MEFNNSLWRKETGHRSKGNLKILVYIRAGTRPSIVTHRPGSNLHGTRSWQCHFSPCIPIQMKWKSCFRNLTMQFQPFLTKSWEWRKLTVLETFLDSEHPRGHCVVYWILVLWPKMSREEEECTSHASATGSKQAQSSHSRTSRLSLEPNTNLQGLLAWIWSLLSIPKEAKLLKEEKGLESKEDKGKKCPLNSNSGYETKESWKVLGVVP